MEARRGDETSQLQVIQNIQKYGKGMEVKNAMGNSHVSHVITRST